MKAMRTFLAGMAIGSAVLSPALMAQDGTSAKLINDAGRPIYLSPMLSFTIDDSARATKNGVGGQFSVGARVFSFLAVEGSAYYTHFNDQANTTVGSPTEVVGYGGNLLIFPFPEDWALRNLYAVIGGYSAEGKNQVAANGGLIDYDSSVFDAGLGYLTAFQLGGNPAALRLEARFREDAHDEPLAGQGGTDSFEDAVLNVGLLFPLFYTPPPIPEPEPEPVPEVVPVGDADGDGVLDDVDQCPDTPAGTAVDATGCPLPVAEPEAPPCKTPGPGEKVDLRGCGTGDVIVLRGVTFDFDKATLTANARTLLDDVVAALQAAAEIKVEVGGHTDARGSEAYNQRLSEQRAQAVLDYLVAAGIDAGRLSAAGYGEGSPVADNETDEGRELNRRVELKVLP
ncbi:MAG TPA: OmpA family protein [Nevskiaceae bacterium]|nr:OmpA family protein [Nevskiaceae bacterium]